MTKQQMLETIEKAHQEAISEATENGQIDSEVEYGIGLMRERLYVQLGENKEITYVGKQK